MAIFLLLALFLFSADAGDDFGSIGRRTDDTSLQSLVTLVQHQSSIIERQEATIKTMQTQTEELQRTVANLTGVLNAVVSRERTRVSFMAQLSPGLVTMGTSSPLRFDKVVTNIGKGYNSVSGVFTAPVTGIYVFYVQLMKHASDHITHFVIDQSGTAICENSLDEPLTYDKSSCLTTVHVQQGEQVFVKARMGSGSLEETCGTPFQATCSPSTFNKAFFYSCSL